MFRLLEKADAPGFEAVVDRLSDALFIKALRWYLDNNCAQPGLAAAVSDPAIHRALQLIHDSPRTPWTVALLAREVAMSRTAFVARFGALMGEPPMTYVNRWRMLLAYRWLREGAPVAEVAEGCGYASEAGFSKAFTRHHDIGPGAVRRVHRMGGTM